MLIFQVTVFGNLSIKNFNEEVFPDFSNFVFIDNPAIISSKISFTDPVLLSEKLLISKDLNTTLLSGFKTEEWLHKAILVNKGLIKGKSKIC